MANDPHQDGGVRLQKIISQAGFASRRAAEDMITQGRVSVDGKVVHKLGTRVDPSRQVVRVDGARVEVDETRHVVLALNKPEGMVSTMYDPEGRPCLSDVLVEYPERLYHVGRLDIDTSGLLLLTNDGELSNRLTHPSFGIEKTYVARVHGEVKPFVRKKLLRGVELDDGFARADRFRVRDTLGDISAVEITVHEGRNRIVRRMLDAVGFPVRELVRIQFGPIRLERLQPGTTRRVKGSELRALYDAVDL